MYRGKRRVLDLNTSRAVTLPAGTPCVKEGGKATVVADRVVIIDPEGEMDPDELLEVLKQVEPLIWERLRPRAKAEVAP